MAAEKTQKISELLHPIIKLLLGIVALIFIKILMVIAIPSFDEGAPNILTHIGIAGNLIINTLILLLLINFGREGKKVLNKITEKTYFGDIFFLTIILITVGLAHWVYKSLAFLLFERYLYFYSLVFLVVAVAFLIILSLKIYKNMNNITGLLLEKIKQIPDIVRKMEKDGEIT